MTKLEIFESAKYVSLEDELAGTDDTLILVGALFEALEEIDGITGVRYLLDEEVTAANEAVLAILDQEGFDALPVTLVDGAVVKKGAYPSLEEFGDYTGLIFSVSDEHDHEGCDCGHHGQSGCDGNGGCGCHHDHEGHHHDHEGHHHHHHDHAEGHIHEHEHHHHHHDAKHE